MDRREAVSRQQVSIEHANPRLGLGARRRFAEWGITAALVLVSLGLFSLEWPLSKSGSLSFVGAERILAGQIPYRDFWTMYAPGHHYLLAAVSYVFGSRFVVGAIAGSILCALAVGLSQRLGLALTGRRTDGILCGLLLLAGLFNLGSYRALGTYPPVLCCMLLALLATARAMGGSGERAARVRPRLVFLAGVATGFAVLFKHDVGGYTALAISAGLATHAWLGTGTRLTRSREAVRRVVRFAAGAALPVVPVALVLAWLAGADMVQDIIVFPATTFLHTRPESYPSLLPSKAFAPDLVPRERVFGAALWAHFALPFGLWLGGLGTIGLAWRQRDTRSAALAVTLCVAFGFHYLAAHAQINTHIATMTIYAACLAVLGLHVVTSTSNRSRRRALGVAAGIVALGWCGALIVEPSWKLSWLLRNSRDFRELQIARGAGTRTWSQAAGDMEQLVEFVHARVPPGAPVYVGLHRHDVVVAGAVAIQFQVARLPATRYHEMHPGVVDTEPVQREMVADLERQGVSVLVLQRVFPDETLEWVKRDLRVHLPQAGSLVLDQYIRDNFEPAQSFGTSTVWLRRTTPGDQRSPAGGL